MKPRGDLEHLKSFLRGILSQEQGHMLVRFSLHNFLRIFVSFSQVLSKLFLRHCAGFLSFS